jgi:hypothetical protein
MPRTSRVRTTSAIEEVQKQIRQLLSNLGSQIRSTEADLRRLKKTELTLSDLAGMQRTSRGGRVTTRRVGDGARINWGSVLKEMPRQFEASDIRKVRGLKDKRPSDLFAAITRWTQAASSGRSEDSTSV